MHQAFGQFAPAFPADVPSSYGEQRVRWPALAAVAIGHVALIAALVSLDIVAIPTAKRPPLVIDMVELPVTPPPQEPEPQAEIQPKKIDQPLIVAPPPVVQNIPSPSPVAVAPAPPPRRVAVVAPPAAKPVPSGPVSMPDLATSMISAKPPKYPLESRRKREQGIVVLTVLVDVSGSVTEVSVAKSSGFARLDKAALEAVQRWRWSPTIRNGQAVMVKGFVDIPFVLQG